MTRLTTDEVSRTAGWFRRAVHNADRKIRTRRKTSQQPASTSECNTRRAPHDNIINLGRCRNQMLNFLASHHETNSNQHTVCENALRTR